MSERVVVVGAGGFGRESLDVLEAMRSAGADLAVTGVIDDAPSPVNLERLTARGTAYLGTIEDWLTSARVGDRFVLGIGSPSVRRLLVEKLTGSDREAFTAVHPSAVIGSQTVIGTGSVVCAGAVISGNVRLGSHVHVNPNATIGHDTRFADFVSVNPGAVISGDVTVQAGVLVGAAAVVLEGRKIGTGAVVGASALVTKDVPEGVVVKGVPGAWDD